MSSMSPVVALALGPRNEGRRSSPAPLVVGVALMVGAFGLDVAAHGAGLPSLEPVAHEAGVLGMVLTWSAVVIDGLLPSARPS